MQYVLVFSGCFDITESMIICSMQPFLNPFCSYARLLLALMCGKMVRVTMDVMILYKIERYWSIVGWVTIILVFRNYKGFAFC